jgi:hypothetical protein
MTAQAAASASVDWRRRNWLLLAVFAPILIATGVSGLVLPAGSSPMSSAPAYDIFHILFGTLGVLIVVGRWFGSSIGGAAARAGEFAARFNLGFGLVDLYQALAGVVGFFPAQVFGLRPADHVVHVLFGLLLAAFGARGLGR